MIIVWADGIGTGKLDQEDERSTLLAVVQRIAENLGKHGIKVHSEKVPWKASMATVGGNTSWHNAAHGGVLAMDEIFQNIHEDEQVILLGYSGGCKVIHDWMDTRPQELHRVVSVGMLSDPFRPSARWQHGTPDPRGYGVAGSRLGPIADRTYWTSWWEDIISSCPSNSLWRTIADLSDKMPGSLIEDFYSHLHLNNWQLANYIGLWRRDPLAYILGLGARIQEAARGANGYLTGAHTSAYRRSFVTKHPGEPDDLRSLCHRLADTVAYKARSTNTVA